MKTHRLVLGIVISCTTCLCVQICQPAELQKFSGVTLVAGQNHDGDSFHVKLDDRKLTIRLYFVDCPETSVTQGTDARRVRTQTRYFGMASHRETVFYGRKATEFTREQLTRPFTLYTAFATAPGRSTGGRCYGFVVTADGQDLAQLLVAKGYARAYGVSRESPDGTHHGEMSARLKDIESAAMLGRKGIWAATDASRLIKLRAAERKEEAELEAIKASVQTPLKPVDINTAASEELQTLPGIGPVLAESIIASRPYKQLDELLKVQGIGPATLKKLRPHVAKLTGMAK